CPRPIPESNGSVCLVIQHGDNLITSTWCALHIPDWPGLGRSDDFAVENLVGNIATHLGIELAVPVYIAISNYLRDVDSPHHIPDLGDMKFPKAKSLIQGLL